VSEQRELPLFPLQTVLFPGMSLPLHIFEERYKLMIGRCVERSQPFGVVMIRTGEEVGPGATIHSVGTTAHITQVERLPGGRMNIGTLGYKRFKIAELRFDEPYLVGMVEDYPLLNVQSPDARVITAKLTPILRSYLEIFASLGNVELNMEDLPEEPETLAFLTAIILRTPMKDKQELLAQPDLVNLLRSEYRILHREAQIMKLLVEAGTRWRDDNRPFSDN
jgi:uncharacterized protein